MSTVSDISEDSSFKLVSGSRSPEQLMDEYRQQFQLSYGSAEYIIPLSKEATSCLKVHLTRFYEILSEKFVLDNPEDEDSIDTLETPELVVLFLDFVVSETPKVVCHNHTTHQKFIGEFLENFERDYVGAPDIHGLVHSLDVPVARRAAVLRGYYAAVDFTGRRPKSTAASLSQEFENGTANLYAYFGGQGTGNTECFNALNTIYMTYGPLLHDLFEVTNSTLLRLSRLPEVEDFYGSEGIDFMHWLENPAESPSKEVLGSAPYSFPIIGIASLANYIVVCKAADISPGEMRKMVKGLTGHSQGIVIAAAIAKSDSWESFYEAAKSAIELLFWIGYECHQNACPRDVSAQAIQDHVENGEGEPSHMLSVKGLAEDSVKKMLKLSNSALPANKHVKIALCNAFDNFVLSGPVSSLRGVVLYIRKVKVASGVDQSRIAHNKRKTEIYAQFMPISAPFHSTYLTHVLPIIEKRVAKRAIKSADLKVSVFTTTTGEDLRGKGDKDVVPDLIRMIVCEPVNWPVATTFPDATHIVDLGPGRLYTLVSQSKEGTGSRVFAAGGPKGGDKGVGYISDAFKPQSLKSTQNWAKDFSPRLVKTASGVVSVDTKLSRLLGMPPVMVAGMTPTTVSWDFVSAVLNAGYQIELAGGGYFAPNMMEEAIRKVCTSVPAGRGLTVNLIYVNPRAMSWQIPLLRQLISEGVPIDGLTIGAGVPSADVAAEYIDTIGLKHIAFKPGSISAIKQVIEIAEARPNFPIVLQWTGGRGGGHHSYEDFHSPIFQLYGRIRRCSNIILVAGSGFGDSEDSYPYLTGSWSEKLGYPAMPFDGVLFGSRMMVAKEAHTSREAKKLIVETEGCEDAAWADSYDRAVGGVITVNSEMSQPIHKIATRGVLFWAELDKTVFSLDLKKRVEYLAQNKDYIVRRLNADSQKPWFATIQGQPTDLEAMTYGEVLRRMVTLMYVEDQTRWIDVTYRALTADFVNRILARFATSGEEINPVELEQPKEFVDNLFQKYPQADRQVMSPQDAEYFIVLCKNPFRKPVNFVPRLDEDFEFWFKKDSLWQAEDLDAVIDRDADRVCILQGPMAVRYSRKVDEPAKDILDSIVNGYVERLQKDFGPTYEPELQIAYSKQPSYKYPKNVKILDEDNKLRLTVPPNAALPDTEEWFEFLSSRLPPWFSALVSTENFLQGNNRVVNSVRKILQPRQSSSVEVRSPHQPAQTSIRLIELTNRGEQRETVSISFNAEKGQGITVNLSEYRTVSPKPAVLRLQFAYDSDNSRYPISEVMTDRNTRIKEFYSQLWFVNPEPITSGGDVILEHKGPKVTITKELASKFMRAAGDTFPGLKANHTGSIPVPMDIAIYASWESLMKPLLSPAINGDLLRLVHLTNGFKYRPGARILEVGDVVQSASTVTGIYIQDSGKVVEVSAVVERDGEPILDVTSSFLCQGVYTDFENTFKVTDEPTMAVAVSSKQVEELLRDREWFVLEDDTTPLVGKQLQFQARTMVRYSTKNTFSALETSGTISEVLPDTSLKQIGSIIFVEGKSSGNPVMDFLTRHGAQVEKVHPLTSPGPIGDAELLKFRAPKSNELYGRISGDYNPIHVSEMFAAYANLPGTITHGMYTSAIVRRMAEMWAGDGEPERFRRYNASFTGMLLPGHNVQVKIMHTGMVRGKKILSITAVNEDTEDTILKAEAEVEEPRTAYVFTGQGSQSQGMGLDLYATSEASKHLWDRADKHIRETYGWSIIDVVKNNPKSLTVHFGGEKGRRIRDNYLSMKIDVTHADGTTTVEPIIKELKPDSESYTFSGPNGLLFSTQFAQPSLTLMERATFADLAAKGLVQEGARFAGHSLGEYSALAAMADFMPIEGLVSVSFYRGLTMQVAMDRDEEGRTDFAMVAVNPSRIMKGFNEAALKSVVSLISRETHLLLEIVNYNIEGQQYVCAGHLRTLHALTELLAYVAKTQPPISSFASVDTSSSLYSTLKDILEDSSATKATKLPRIRTASTVPLEGIDVPFHSSQLLPGVGSFRKFLNTRVKEDDIDPEKLIGRWVPNLTGKTFEMTKEYVEELRQMTGSEVIAQMLAEWDDVWADE